ncbi:MAG TPA: amino acid adenylation domain-containing protein [Thermoanaerobaculia bacterium]|nr:amino acid adenylation domain-containing protein [Thermoanaerobaculia bacterium]
MTEHLESPQGIAVISLAGRFPGAADVDRFWQNIRDGVEAITFFSDEELLAAGIPADRLRAPSYVRARGVLAGADLFDAGFFDYSPREAEVMDPQHRLFLECAWEALESAGYANEGCGGAIGVYAGASPNTYLLNNLIPQLGGRDALGGMSAAIAGGSDYLTTRVSYKLNLRGPSIAIQTACSTSLVAVNLACQALLDYQCDIALAGGVSVRLPQISGYSWQEGGILSPDGHCRTFDARARGTVGGNGVGIVVLKRLEEALADEDTIHAVILGTAINNDGSEKVSYSAPGVDGQAKVIVLAQALAGVEPESITYVEAHGTGTTLGDPVEVAALSKVFRFGTDRKTFCALGAVKTNIGHLDAAAGIAGLIKTIMALRHKQIPPSLHFERPNPEIQLEESPFYISTRLASWDTGGRPRRAGVSSFGIGGTNAHAVLEEAPPVGPPAHSRPWQLLVLSAKTPSALEMSAERLAAHLTGTSGQDLADVAHTLRVGRRSFPYRRALVCRDAEEGRELLNGSDPRRILDGCADSLDRPVAFLLSGLGDQYVGMGLGLYRHEPVFREQVDRCAELLKPDLGIDLRDLIYPRDLREEEGRQGLDFRALLGRSERRGTVQLDRTDQVQPALFTVEYALARLLMSWGIRPQSLLGYSLGEYVAACLAGVFSLEDALLVVTERARMIQELPAGAMLAVPLGEQRIEDLLGRSLSLAAVNAPELSVVAGPVEDVVALERSLSEDGLACRRLQTTHAFHSWMMEPVAGRLADLVKRVRRNPPSIPYLSNVTGRWISAAEATDPFYWAEHLCRTVRFGNGVAELWREGGRVLIEVGPGQTLCSLALQHPASPAGTERIALPSLRNAHDRQPDQAYLLGALGALWVSGVSPDWVAFTAGERRRRVPLPTYPFERRRYWIEPHPGQVERAPSEETSAARDWLRVPVWRRTALPRGHGESGSLWLLFVDCRGIGARLAQHLRRAGQQVVTVQAGERYARLDDRIIEIDPHRPEDHDALLSAFAAAHVVDLRALDPERDELSLEVLSLVQALGRRGTEAPIRFTLVSDGAQPVTGEEPLRPDVAAALGLLRVAASELPHVTLRSVDMVSLGLGEGWDRSLARLASELLSTCSNPFVAYRGGLRWVEGFDPILPQADEPGAFRRGGVYLLAGALRGVGLALARHLAGKLVRLALSGAEPGRAEDLRRLGAEVLEVADGGPGLAAVVRAARERLGPLDGILVELGDEAPARLVDLDGARWLSSIRDAQATVASLDEALSGQEPSLRLLLAPAGDVPGCALSAARGMALLSALSRYNRSGSPPWTLVRFTGGDLTEAGAAAVERAFMVGEMPDLIVSTAALSGEHADRGTASAHAMPAASGVPRERRGHPRPKLRNAYVAPLNEVERGMAGLWGALLGIDRVGRHDSFFELGGHSLLGTQLLSRVRDLLGVQLSFTDLFEAPTVEGLSAKVEQARAADRLSQVLPLVPMPRGADLPLSFAQQRLWFLDRLEPGNPAYNLAGGLRLSGPLDAAALARALSEVVRRHEALRTTFTGVDGTPVQVIAPPAPLPLPVLDLTELPAAGRAAVESELAHGEARRPFDLARGPLLRALLVRLSDREHALIVTMHHIVSDGWSLSVLVRELGALYSAFTTDQPSPLPELPIQYADFALWQREWLQGDSLTAQLDWWKRLLAGAPAALELPTDRPRPAVPSHIGGHAVLDLSGKLTAQLEELGRRLGTTPFMTLLTGLAVLLSRYSGQRDLVVGTPIANRNRTEVESLIGFFVNTLVLRTALEGSQSFTRLSAQVRETALGAYARQDLPFEKLVEELRPDRDLRQPPLFQILFILQNVPGAPWDVLELAVAPLGVDTGHVQFDLTLSLVLRQDGLQARLDYSRDLFDVSTAARLLLHYRNLLDALSSGPDAAESPVSSLPLLSAAERSEILVAWNATATEIPASLLHEPFEAQASRTPDAVAAVCGTESLTYRELNVRANRLARYLCRLGVGPEAPVGLLAERSLDLLTALLAVLKSGGFYVPLDPSYPPDRLAWVLEDARVLVLLTQASVRGVLPETRAWVIELGSTAAWQDESPDDLEPLAGPENLAYAIYTSGSTGRPKGVQIRHRSAVNFLASMAGEPGMALDDVLLAVTTVSFDIALLELLLPLWAGARVVIASREDAADGARLARLLDSAEATVLQATPSTWRMLLETGWQGRTGLRALCGGEALPCDLADRLLEVTPELWNLYGPTETTVWSAVQRVVEGARPVPVGRPIANTEVYVVDGAFEAVPVGVPGELFIGGEGLARGYLGRPDLTAERFVPDAFGPPGDRLYRTGDLARWLPAGELELLGRIDHQVKVRGFRIEPGEIEAVLERHPGVAQAVVVAREDTLGDRRLVAYIVARQKPAPTASELRALAQRELPGYMVPSAYVTLEALPLTPNGKMDRKALPAPEDSRPASAGETTAPEGPVEELLASTWQAVLGLASVARDDHFFDLGGHSLRATQVAVRLGAALGVEIPLRVLFEAPILSDLARRVSEVLGGLAAALPPLVRAPRNGGLPLSFAQQRLWFLDHLVPDNPVYNIPLAIRLRGEMDPAALEQSLATIVERHEVLRTVFEEQDGIPRQVVLPELRPDLPCVDLQGLGAADRRREAERLARETAVHPFHLCHGPLARFLRVALGNREHLLLATVHHVVWDGWSTGVFLSELASCYQAFCHGDSPFLPDLPVQYGDFTVWQQSWLQGQVLSDQLAFWRSRLEGVPVLELPTDRPRPPVQTHRGHLAAFTLGRFRTEAILSLAGRSGATPFMALLAAYQVLLARYSGQQDLAIGTPVANRRHRDLEGLIGFFVNTLALRGDLSGRPGFRELLHRVRAATLEAYLHQDIPFEKLVDELRLERDLSRSPLFQVLIVFHNVPRPDLSISGLELSLLATDTGTSRFDMVLSMGMRDGELIGWLNANAALFDTTTIERLLSHLRTLIERLIADPQAVVDDLPLLSEAERFQLLEEWNDTGIPYPPDRLFHGLVELWADRTPETEALVFEGESLTYRELDHRANRLAHHLRRLGAGPEVRVGLCMERSAEQIVSLLAILKAGAAYVPLDPAYPRKRLDLLLEDSGAALLLTQKRLITALPERVPVLCVDSLGVELDRESDQRPEVDIEPAHLAYVIYTSGSTGRPKGVLIPHRGVSNLAEAQVPVFRLRPGSRLLLFAPLIFDTSVYELVMTFRAGATLVVASQDSILPGAPLLSILREQRITHLTLTPSALAALPESDLPELEVLAVAGEACAAELVERWGRGRRFLNAYGPTENTVWATAQPCEPRRRPPIGRPVGNKRLYVLDAAGQPVPAGVAGELHLGGVGLARGYLGRPDLTAERFIPDPFHGCGERLYRTGDVVRYLPNGEIDFLGRADNQVKIRGFRIELGEVEEALRRHPAVREVAVLAREDEPGRKRLVAYVVAGEDAAPDTRGLREFLMQSLPEYMLPAAFVFLSALPRTANDKVDWRALLPPGQARPDREESYVAPRDERERVLAAIWQEVLRLDQVGVADNYFELGGDSILSIQIVSRAKRAGLALNPRHVFQHQTIEELAAVATEAIPAQADRFTPSPVRKSKLDQLELDRLVSRIGQAARKGN